MARRASNRRDQYLPLTPSVSAKKDELKSALELRGGYKPLRYRGIYTGRAQRAGGQFRGIFATLGV